MSTKTNNPDYHFLTFWFLATLAPTMHQTKCWGARDLPVVRFSATTLGVQKTPQNRNHAPLKNVVQNLSKSIKTDPSKELRIFGRHHQILHEKRPHFAKSSNLYVRWRRGCRTIEVFFSVILDQNRLTVFARWMTWCE